MANHNYKCTDTKRCGKRRKLTKPIEQYVVRPKCLICGKGLYHQPDVKRRNRERTCECGGRPYPHNKEGTVWCDLHPTGPTVLDYGERYGWDNISDWEVYTCLMEIENGNPPV